MSRLFTLNVPFDGTNCPALVGLRTQGYDLCFFVHFLNKEVSRFFPQGNLEFSLSEGLKQPRILSNEAALNLVSRTVDAISDYLKDHALPG